MPRAQPCSAVARIGIVIIGVGLSAIIAVGTAHAASIHIAWDPSPEPGVIGYRVYVGTKSRVYTEAYDVGPRTSFVYEGLPGQRYYFAVATYLPGAIVGLQSDEVSGYAGDTPSGYVRGGVADLTSQPQTHTGAALRPDNPIICSGSRGPDCFDVKQVVGSSGEITSLALLPDGRLIFIEDRRRVRIVVGNRLLPEPALEMGPLLRMTHAAVDPAFPHSGFIFIGVVETREDGRRELQIVRFRLVQNLLGESATIITGLPLGTSGSAPFTLDRQGHLYVALPAVDDSGTRNRDTFSGTILRLNTDGTVPRDNPTTSPVLAHGYARPVAVEWDPDGERLWLSGVEPRFPRPIAYLEVGASEPREWPQIPSPASVRRSGSLTPEYGSVGVAIQSSSPQVLMLFPADHQGVHRQLNDDRSSPEFGRLVVDTLGAPSAIASGPDGQIYIALRTPSVERGPDTFIIVKLQPQP